MAKREGREGLVLADGASPKLRRRGSGWTKAQEEAFLASLAATCNVTVSAEEAGVGQSSVYKRRMRDAGFRARWAAALREGYAKLELMLLERAMNGSVKTVERGGAIVDRTTEFPNAIALQLLRLHKDSAAADEAEPAEEEIEAVRERIIAKLAAVRKRIEAQRGAA